MRLPDRALLLLVLALALAYVHAAAGVAAAPTRLKVALLTDIPTKASTHDFRGLEYLGFVRAVKDFHVEGRVVQIDPKHGAAPTLAALGRQRYDLIYTGLAPASEVEAAAAKFPATRFLYPGAYAYLKRKPKNVEGEDFRIEQAGFLAGYLAALMEERRPGRHVLGSVGGFPIPYVDRWIAGFEAGARRADPHIGLLRRYSHDFQDPAKCKAVATGEIADGATVLFQVAGLCGAGTLAAAKEMGVWGIGVDGDQSYVGAQVLTSAVARYDVFIYRAIQLLTQGRFRTGGDYRYDVANGGVTLGAVSPKVPLEVRRQVAAVRAQIAAGRIVVPTTIK